MIENILFEQENISYKEENLLKFVFSKYKVEVNKVNKYRNLYKVESIDGVYCFKKIRHGRNIIVNEDYIIENLYKNGFSSIGRFKRTKEGNLYVKSHRYIFYLTEYMEGRECDFENLTEAVNCASLLAKFHLGLNCLDTKGLKIKNKLKDLPKVFYDKLLSMEKFKQIIEKKRIKNEFDLIYLNNIDNFYNIGSMTLNILNNSNYYSFAKEATKERTLSLNNFYNSIIINEANEYFVVGLKNITVDLQIMDLARFISRLMYKEYYQWSFDKFKYIIEGYTKLKPLSKEELELVLAVISFPHKFWKLGNKRYIKQKGWSEPKYIRKIEKLIDNFNLQQKFFMDFLNYINYTNISE